MSGISGMACMAQAGNAIFYTEPNTQMIKVSIVEDDDEIRESLAVLISGTPEYVCLNKYRSGEAALKSIKSEPPDVLLMDIGLPGMSGIECVGKAKELLPSVDIIMLTVHEDDEYVFKSLCAGASGYLPKNTPPARLLEAIKEVRGGGAPMSPSIARMVVGSFKQTHHSSLTQREVDVLAHLCRGGSYREIADTLFVTEETIRSHIKNIYRKLEVHSKSEAVAKALKERLVRSA